MVTLQKGWAGAGCGGEHSLIVYLRVVSTKAFIFVTLQRAHCIPCQLPRVSTQPDITRHWYLLMFHILPSGASTTVKKNNKTREAMRRHTQKKQITPPKTQVQVTRASRVKDQGCSWLLAIVLSSVFNTWVGFSKCFIARQWRHLDM